MMDFKKLLILTTATLCYEHLCQAAPVNIRYSLINFPYHSAYINAKQLTVTGSLLDDHKSPVINETLEIFLNNILMGKTVSNNDGIFELQLPQDLLDGQYVVTVFCLESEVLLEPSIITIDTTLPSIAITSPHEHDIIYNSTFTVSGTTQDNAMIETFLDEDTYGLVCYADDSGNWSIDYTADSGLHSIKAQSTDRAGNRSLLSPVRFFTINTLL
ncbi:MAG: hypothetical protein IT346_01795 [Epsilonproteobacteria bacterium]|nr:hypothetical protein [Campylobacterota bacterium]